MKIDSVHYMTEDKSMDIELRFITRKVLRFYHVGKAWPKHTQCLLFVNGLLKGFETIVKHAYDEDNPQNAYKRVAEQVMKNNLPKHLRNEVRKELNYVIKWNSKITEKQV